MLCQECLTGQCSFPSQASEYSGVSILRDETGRYLCNVLGTISVQKLVLVGMLTCCRSYFAICGRRFKEPWSTFAYPLVFTSAYKRSSLDRVE